MSNSFKNPLTPQIASPVNIDKHIQELQNILAALPWVEKSFGRAFDAYKEIDGKPYTYPQVWQGAGLDLLNVMPNDNLASQVFWRVEDPGEVLEFVPNGNSMMRYRASAIFWFNYKEIDPAHSYPFIELLKGQAIRAITEGLLTGSSVEISRTWEGPDNVYRGYTIDKVKNQDLVYPWGGFRIECLITFEEACPDSLYSLPE